MERQLGPPSSHAANLGRLAIVQSVIQLGVQDFQHAIDCTLLHDEPVKSQRPDVFGRVHADLSIGEDSPDRLILGQRPERGARAQGFDSKPRYTVGN